VPRSPPVTGKTHLFDEAGETVCDLDASAALTDSFGAEMKQNEPCLGSIRQPLNLHLSGLRIFQTTSHNAERVPPILAEELTLTLRLSIREAAKRQNAVDVLDVLRRTRCGFNHFAHGIAAPLITAHRCTPGLDGRLLCLLSVAQFLLMRDMLDNGLEHEVTTRSLDLFQEIGITDHGKMFVSAHTAS
jgi:hypothetical protein